MGQKRNLCAMIPESLHSMVRQEQSELGITLAEYVIKILNEHFQGGKNMNNTRTLAFQISEELFLRIKVFLEAEQNRTGKKISQKEFVVGLIEQALPPAEQKQE